MFIEENSNGLIYMRSDIIGAKHAFTTRYGGVSTGEFASLNLGSNRGDDPKAVRENYRRICALFGVGENDACVTNQVHKTDVRIVTAADKHTCLGPTPYEADGIVTADKGLPIFCFVADCVPVLLWDAKNRAIGAVHCGWRSAVGDILMHALTGMTDDDVPDAITAWLSGETEGLFVRRADGKTMVDLRLANARRLLQLGVPVKNIDLSDECTFCSHDKYWSHRYTKGRRGSQAAVIML